VSAKRARRERPLSELEGCVLGHLLRRGPCTPYAVRRSFQLSPSSHWSGSAGAVYPALERLEERGLVRSVHAPRGGRKAWRYALTARGRARFNTWLEPPFAPDVLSVPPDPLRTRVHFFSTMTPARRARFVAAAVTGIGRHLEVLARSRGHDEDDRRALAAARHALRARMRWLAGLRAP